MLQSFLHPWFLIALFSFSAIIINVPFKMFYTHLTNDSYKLPRDKGRNDFPPPGYSLAQKIELMCVWLKCTANKERKATGQFLNSSHNPIAQMHCIFPLRIRTEEGSCQNQAKWSYKISTPTLLSPVWWTRGVICRTCQCLFNFLKADQSVMRYPINMLEMDFQ